MLANEFIRLPIHMIDRLPPGAPRWGLGHKQAMRDWHKRTIAVMGQPSRFPQRTPGSLSIQRARQVGNACGAHLGQRASPHL